jgi:hypothetical protein
VYERVRVLKPTNAIKQTADLEHGRDRIVQYLVFFAVVVHVHSVSTAAMRPVTSRPLVNVLQIVVKRVSLHARLSRRASEPGLFIRAIKRSLLGIMISTMRASMRHESTMMMTMMTMMMMMMMMIRPLMAPTRQMPPLYIMSAELFLLQKRANHALQRSHVVVIQCRNVCLAFARRVMRANGVEFKFFDCAYDFSSFGSLFLDVDLFLFSGFSPEMCFLSVFFDAHACV